MIYNDEDVEILSLLKTNENYIRKIPYSRPNFTVKNNKFFIETDEGLLPLKILKTQHGKLVRCKTSV